MVEIVEGKSQGTACHLVHTSLTLPFKHHHAVLCMTCLFQTQALASMTLAYSQLANIQQTRLTLSVQRSKLIKQRPWMFGTCAQQASRCGTFLQQHSRMQLLLCHAFPLACFDQQCALQGMVVYLPLAQQHAGLLWQHALGQGGSPSVDARWQCQCNYNEHLSHLSPACLHVIDCVLNCCFET